MVGAELPPLFFESLNILAPAGRRLFHDVWSVEKKRRPLLHWDNRDAGIAGVRVLHIFSPFLRNPSERGINIVTWFMR